MKSKRKLTSEQMTTVKAEKYACEWWQTEGRYIDPDTAEVDWYDKRGELAQFAFIAGFTEGMRVS